MTSELYVPKGTTADVNYVLDIDPKRAGWTYSSLRIVELAPGGTHTFTTGDSEWIVLPLQGACTVRVEDEEFHLSGRGSVFASVTDFAYAPRDARAQIASGAGGRFALAGAKCERQLPARYGPAPEVPDARCTPPRCVLLCRVADLLPPFLASAGTAPTPCSGMSRPAPRTVFGVRGRAVPLRRSASYALRAARSPRWGSSVLLRSSAANAPTGSSLGTILWSCKVTPRRWQAPRCNRPHDDITERNCMFTRGSERPRRPLPTRHHP
ncbi:hypothetical protein GCM10010320_02940 [Streptomyces caelestis]|uniref:5-deoxy-glucuronate isomerase n=1 Tax=Streptomyces caelestis TaxID=36816 RepID=A0A7W9H3X6_9ACTN|nr:hypothetical protein [Streptomyces caelestis]GGW27631.1 hypothetical protein GCM10010320_02940 [Streptomyces caelestis]